MGTSLATNIPTLLAPSIVCRRLARTLFIFLVGFLGVGRGAHAITNNERLQNYNELFFGSTNSQDHLNKKISPALKGTRQLLTVLPGVLYRGGGPGGKKPLSTDILKNLCEAGFSLAVYSYTEGYSDPGPIKCVNKLTGQTNEIRYIAGGVLDKKFKARFLSETKNVAEKPDLGPVFVHCWNGLHASGELAAISLRQFCGWSGKKASQYWLNHAGGYPLISRINKFVPSDALVLSDELRGELCISSDEP